MKGRRPLPRTKEERITELQKAIGKSGFTGQEVMQILCDWYGYREMVLYSGTIRETISNSTLQGN